MSAEPRNWKWSKSFYMGGETNENTSSITWESRKKEHLKSILETPPTGLYKNYGEFMLITDGVVDWDVEKLTNLNDDIARVFLYNVCENFKSLNNLRSL